MARKSSSSPNNAKTVTRTASVPRLANSPAAQAFNIWPKPGKKIRTRLKGYDVPAKTEG